YWFDMRLAADEPIGADRHVLVDGHFRRNRRVRLDVNVAAEHRSHANRDPISELAVVGDVHPGAEVIVTADAGDTVLLLGRAVNGHALVDQIGVADLHTRRPTPV